MRNSLKDVFNNAITLQYKLPNSIMEKSKITTSNDFVFKAKDDKEVANLIYNSIVDLAFDDYHIDINNLNKAQTDALSYRIRYNVGDDESKLKLGFYGEALLNVFLQMHFGTNLLVARGEFFDLLSNSEIHGYDCHHIIERNNSIEFWWGEAKFYYDYAKALESVWHNINKDISLEFFNKNLQVIIQRNYNITAKGRIIEDFINECKEKPFRNFYDDIKKYDGKLVYPIMIISNELQNNFDESIQKFVDKINELSISKQIIIPQDLTIELFFIFLPVEDVNIIKKDVLKWIQTNKTLI